MKVVLKIEGMSCSACSNSLEKYLNKQEKIKSASVNLVLGQALIEYDESLSIDDLNNFVKEAGFKSLGEYDSKKENNKNKKSKKILLPTTILLVMIYITLSQMLPLPNFSFISMKNHPINYGVTLFIFSIIFMVYGKDVIKNGIHNLIHKTPNMNTLVTTGVLASFLYSSFNLIMVIIGKKDFVNHLYFESIAMIIYFVKLGRIIDNSSKEKTKEALKELVQITPSKALLSYDGEIKEIDIDEIKKGDILISKPGSKIAVDGIIIDGIAHIDESFLIGESSPVKKKVNDKIRAGSINMDGMIIYEAESIGKDSTISEIVRLVIEATNSKTKIGRLADKISGYFVPIVFIIAIIALVFNLVVGHGFNNSLISFVTVLTIACPCALGLGAPLAIIVSISSSAKEGILIKSGVSLEEIKKIDTVIFDKTGTLTHGSLKVSEIFNYSTYTNKEIIDIVSSLETNSNHPIATAFNSKNIKKVEKFSNISGLGISGIIDNNKYYIGNNKLLTKLNIEAKYKYSCRENELHLAKNGNSIIYVLENKKVIALIGVKDTIRESSKEIVTNLLNMKKNVIMLSGDNVQAANIIAESIGIKNVIASVMPKDKKKYIDQLIKEKHKVMMIGDGINDAPSLAGATIGVSINSGNEIATDSADVILIHDDLNKIKTLFEISHKTIKIIKENLFWALFYNLIMMIISIGIIHPFGITITPPVASVAMVISSLTVIFNSLRLRKV